MLAFVWAVNNANAADLTTDNSSDSKISSDKNLSIKNSTEKKDSKTKRKSKSVSQGRDKTEGSSDKESGSVADNGGLDTVLPAPLLFIDWVPPIPRLPSDFGLSGEQHGYINVTVQEYLSQAARVNKLVTDVVTEKNANALRQYLIDVAESGAVLGQAQLYLQGDTSRLGKILRKEDGTVEVRGLGQDDLLLLATAALKRAQAQITDTRIRKQLNKIRADTTPCRFVGEPSLIQCGLAVLTLSSPPVLKLTGMPWYAADGFNTGFAGISASYKVASSWSWSKALEEAKSDSTFTKWATEASIAAENLEAQGKSLEASMTRRKAIEKMQKSGQGLSASKFIPGIH
jgi:hypothetical protein